MNTNERTDMTTDEEELAYARGFVAGYEVGFEEGLAERDTPPQDMGALASEVLAPFNPAAALCAEEA